MAVARTAQVVAAQHTAGSCVVELEVAEPLGFVGGQYIIVDSGQVLPSGKAAKRAYSILSSDADQRRLVFAIKRIPDGVVSAFMHGVAPGQSFAFSGPWGKLGPAAGTSDPGDGATLIVATDTGVTAALGLVQSMRMQPLLARTTLVWLQPDGEDFLPADWVRARLPAALGEVRFGTLPPIGHPERVPFVRALVAAELARPAGLARGYIAGDGAVNYGVLDDLVAAGVPATRDSVESFFNMPKKSA